jgi:hypothetical protein
MGKPKRSDYETLSLFVILGVLTLAFVMGVRWVLFAPTQDILPARIEQKAER